MKDIPILDKYPELDIAIKAAQEAGDAILKIYEGEFEEFTKKDDSPITEADLKSNEIIKEILNKQSTKYYLKKIMMTKVDYLKK